ncbi:MAG TPA: LysE/ArgO family amino acid transporter, partial [Gammaproteobacteria bacterium]|nr:LysE/ArgO family amino acid transporter [Gammaproteobacteria bacterium]
MLSAFLSGFILGFSLILAIGSQNSFVLRQGLMNRHVFIVALFCSLSDALLIGIGVVGISLFLNNYIDLVSDWLFGISAIWLAGYGILRLRDAVIGKSVLIAENSSVKGLVSTLSFLSVLTFANPHVYLDTVVLIGSVSQQFPDNTKLAYVLGASIASFVFFFSLAYGAKLLSPIMQKPIAWRILDSFIAFVMFSLAIKMTH